MLSAVLALGFEGTLQIWEHLTEHNCLLLAINGMAIWGLYVFSVYLVRLCLRCH